MTGYPVMGCIDLIYKLYFLTWGLGLVYRRNSTKFLVDFWVLEYFRVVRSLGLVGILFFFKQVVISECLVGFWLVSRKLGHTQGHTTLAMCRPLGRDMTILLVSELTIFKIFLLFLRVQWMKVIVLISCFVICLWMWTSVPFVDKMNIPPRRGHDRPRRALMDEETTSAPHDPPP